MPALPVESFPLKELAGPASCARAILLPERLMEIAPPPALSGRFTRYGLAPAAAERTA